MTETAGPNGKPDEYAVQLRWSDEDRLGHINNTRYLTFAEDARLRLMSQLRSAGDGGADGPGPGGGILARLECDFRAQGHATPDSSVVVSTTVTRIGTSSLDMRQVLTHSDGTLLAEVVAVLVSFDYARNAARPWSDDERSWLREYAEGEV